MGKSLLHDIQYVIPQCLWQNLKRGIFPLFFWQIGITNLCVAHWRKKSDSFQESTSKCLLNCQCWNKSLKCTSHSDWQGEGGEKVCRICDRFSFSFFTQLSSLLQPEIVISGHIVLPVVTSHTSHITRAAQTGMFEQRNFISSKCKGNTFLLQRWLNIISSSNYPMTTQWLFSIIFSL